MWLEDIGNYIRDASLDGIGQNVFLYTLKANESGAMLTMHSQGITAVKEFPNYYKGQMQLIVRNSDLKQSLTQALAIMQLIDSRNSAYSGQGGMLRLDSCIMNYVIPRHYPVSYSRSDGDFYETSVNFDVCFVDVSA